MKISSIFYGVILQLGIICSVQAQVAVTLTFEQTVINQELVIEIYAENKGEPFVLGSCNLPFKDLRNDLDWTKAVLNDTANLPFSDANPTSYSGPEFSQPGFNHIYFMRKHNGTGKGLLFTGKQKLASIKVPIINACGGSHLEWILDRGTITTYDNIKIKESTTYQNADKYSFQVKKSDPIIVKEGNTLTSSNSKTYQWIKDGELIPGAVTQSIVIDQNGTYQVKASDDCSDLISNKIPVDLDKEKLHLSAFPNPYIEETTIQYEINETSKVLIEVFDVSGFKVMTLEDSSRSKGVHKLLFSASDNGLGAGIYFVKLIVGNEVFSTRLVQINH